jgi:hypothetical protein
MGVLLVLVACPKKPYTASMVRALGAVLLLVTVTSTVRGEESTRPHGAAAPGPLECAPPESTDPVSEERAFSVELERFASRRAFTERLVAEREADAFEQASLRQARMTQLRRELTEREAAMSEREFNDALALYLKKRALTRELSIAASRAKAAPAAPAP